MSNNELTTKYTIPWIDTSRLGLCEYVRWQIKAPLCVILLKLTDDSGIPTMWILIVFECLKSRYKLPIAWWNTGYLLLC